jgi:hypothetical protein
MTVTSQPAFTPTPPMPRDTQDSTQQPNMHQQTPKPPPYKSIQNDNLTYNQHALTSFLSNLHSNPKEQQLQPNYNPQKESQQLMTLQEGNNHIQQNQVHTELLQNIDSSLRENNTELRAIKTLQTDIIRGIERVRERLFEGTFTPPIQPRQVYSQPINRPTGPYPPPGMPTIRGGRGGRGAPRGGGFSTYRHPTEGIALGAEQIRVALGNEEGGLVCYRCRLSGHGTRTCGYQAFCVYCNTQGAHSTPQHQFRGYPVPGQSTSGDEMHVDTSP